MDKLHTFWKRVVNVLDPAWRLGCIATDSAVDGV